jgi:hypothetical protein
MGKTCLRKAAGMAPSHYRSCSAKLIRGCSRFLSSFRSPVLCSFGLSCQDNKMVRLCSAKETQITEGMPLNRRGRGGRRGNHRSRGYGLLLFVRQGRKNTSGVSAELHGRKKCHPRAGEETRECERRCSPAALGWDQRITPGGGGATCLPLFFVFFRFLRPCSPGCVDIDGTGIPATLTVPGVTNLPTRTIDRIISNSSCDPARFPRVLIRPGPQQKNSPHEAATSSAKRFDVTVRNCWFMSRSSSTRPVRASASKFAMARSISP